VYHNYISTTLGAHSARTIYLLFLEV